MLLPKHTQAPWKDWSALRMMVCLVSVSIILILGTLVQMMKFDTKLKTEFEGTGGLTQSDIPKSVLMQNKINFMSPDDETSTGDSVERKLRRPLVPSEFEEGANIPRCAQSLLASLYEESPQKEQSIASRGSSHNFRCNGFMLRDDKILVNLDCARKAAIVDIPGLGRRPVMEVVGDGEHGLAVVKVILQSQDQFSGWPRLRMVLRRDYDEDNVDAMALIKSSSSAFKIECDGNLPVLTAFYSVGKSLRSIDFLDAASSVSDELKVIPSYASDWRRYMAEMVNESREYWWVERDTKENLVNAIVSAGEKYIGPEGSLSVASTGEKRPLLEALDPMGGREYNCLLDYFDYWTSSELSKQAFSGEPFFEWLDFGSGRQVDLLDCPRADLNHGRMKFFNMEEREKTAVVIEVRDSGRSIRLKYKETGQPLRKGMLDYVWGLDQRFYAAPEIKGVTTIGHSSFFAAGPVLLAGEIEIGDGGKLLDVNSSSGHYKPKRKHLKAFCLFLRGLGAERAEVGFREDSKASSDSNASADMTLEMC